MSRWTPPFWQFPSNEYFLFLRQTNVFLEAGKGRPSFILRTYSSFVVAIFTHKSDLKTSTWCFPGVRLTVYIEVSWNFSYGFGRYGNISSASRRTRSLLIVDSDSLALSKQSQERLITTMANTEPIDVEKQRYPYSIVWTPIPLLTLVFMSWM